jgi:hypothetical protein
VSTATEEPNVLDEVKEVILEDLEQIRLKLSKETEITNLKYYLGKTSHLIKDINPAKDSELPLA